MLRRIDWCETRGECSFHHTYSDSTQYSIVNSDATAAVQPLKQGKADLLRTLPSRLARIEIETKTLVNMGSSIMHECVNSGIAPNERNDSHAKGVSYRIRYVKAARFEDHVIQVKF